MNAKTSPDHTHPALVLLRRLLPNAACWGLTFQEHLPDPAGIPSQERRSLLRHAQEAAGNECVEVLLRMSNLPIRPVPNGEGGERLWPDGFVGSLSYKNAAVLGALGTHQNIKMLGIDLESSGPQPLAPIKSSVAPEGLPSGLDEEMGTLYSFSAKEAVFKAQYPTTHSRLSFSDVKLAWKHSDAFGGIALATCPGSLSLEVGLAVSGRWVVSIAFKNNV